MQIELWERMDEDGNTEDGIALYKLAALCEQGYVALVTP